MHFTEAEILCRIRDGLAGRLGASRYRTWFGEATEFHLADDVLQVAVPNAFVQSWIVSNYLVDLREVACFACERDMRVSVVAAGKNTPKSSPAPGAKPGQEPLLAPLSSHGPAPSGGDGHGSLPDKNSAPGHRLGNGSARGPANQQPQRQANGSGHGRSFNQAAFRNGPRASKPIELRGDLDAFVVGPSNELAYTCAMRLVQSPGAPFKSLFIHGNCGVGKTHLLQGICNALRRTHPSLEWRYVSGEEFTNEFVQSVKAAQIDRFRARFRHIDVLVIDDIHFLANKKATQEEFLHTFNAIDGHGKAVVLSSDRHPRDITELSQPLLSRLLAGMVAPIEPPTRETRQEILRRRILTMPQRIPDDVVDFIAGHIINNVRELEGALSKLQAVASLSKEPITLPFARIALADHLDRIRPARPAPASGAGGLETAAVVPTPQAAVVTAGIVAEIERIVAERLGLSPALLRSATRDSAVTLARALVIFLYRRQTGLSYPEIGRNLGHKGHSTVLSSCKRIEQMLAANERLAWRTAAGLLETVFASEVVRELESVLKQRTLGVAG